MELAKKEERLLIGGEWVEASGGTYSITNPATEQEVGSAPKGTVDDAHMAAAAARRAWPAWAATPAEERLALMARAADAIRKRAKDLLPLVIAETGATAAVGSRMQVPVAADRFERYSRDIHHVTHKALPPQLAKATPLAPGGVINALALRQPVGVVACITSYNFPMVNMAGKVAPALAMGNTVVVKPAPQDPLAVIELVRILDEVGFPPGVVNLLVAPDAEPAVALVESADVDMVSFTGSTKVGIDIAGRSARTMKRLLLELGGKGACVVLEDADQRAGATCISSTWSFHSGQICTAPTRALVHRSIFDDFVDQLAEYAGALAVGDPELADTVVGPLISEAQLRRVEGFVAQAHGEGAKVVAGGGRPEGLDRGFYFEPTLIVGDNSMTVAREEIFGPVVVAMAFDDDDEAVEMANDSEFGLYDYVYSADTERAFRVAKQLRAGHVGVNTAQRNHEAAFGGMKMSGVGRDGGDYGLEAYSELQSIIYRS